MKSFLPMRFFTSFFLLFAASTLLADPASDRAEAPHLKVRLVCGQTALIPGQTALVGVYFQMQKGWHLYWKNPGDSGLPPSIKWTLPPGFKAGDLKWPIPERIKIPSLTDFGYLDHLLLMAPVHVPAGLKEGMAVTLKAEARWLVCNEECIPGQAVLNLSLPVRQEVGEAASKDRDLFTETKALLANPLPLDWTSKGSVDRDGMVLQFKTGAVKISNADFFTLDPNVLDYETDPVFKAGPSSFSLKLKKSDQLLQMPAELKGLLVVNDSKGRKSGYWTDIKLK